MSPYTYFSLYGCFLGAFGFDILSRLGYRAVVHQTGLLNEVKQAESKQKALEAAAKCIGVNLDVHNFNEAKTRFRTKLLKVHPDKASDEKQRMGNHLKTQDLLASWQLLRGHYEQAGCCRCKLVLSLTYDDHFIILQNKT